MLCPRCGHEEPGSFSECPACGVLVDRIHGPLERRPAPPAALPRSTFAGGQSVGGTGLWPPETGRTVAVGALLAFGVYAVPAARFVFGHLGTVAHELGHTVVAWSMGYPAVPALDLLEGGGVSIRYARSPALCVTMVGLAWLVVYLVRRSRWLIPACGLAGLHVLLLLSPLHDAAIVAAGHGAELLVAGLAICRGLAGEGTLGERVAWLSAGAFVLLLNGVFGLRLLTDPGELERYAAARRGESGMDLARLAEAFGVGIDGLAALIVVASLLVPSAALLWARSSRG